MRSWFQSRPSPAMLVAFAALMVALGGTAYAATTLVNIADPITPANKARVDVNGALKTAGTSTVTGFVGETAPKTPFFGQRYISPSGTETLIAANKATMALTRLSFDNYHSNTGAANVNLAQQGGNATVCNGASGYRNIGSYNVGIGETFSDSMGSPLVLKPLSAGTVWCLIASTTIQGNPSSYYLPGVAWSGYVVAGTPPAGTLAAAAKATSTSAVPPRVGN